jgi:ribosome-associated heat shock protein Hsp15
MTIDMAEPSGERGIGAAAGQRLDRWLWFSRILKSRTLAAQLIADGKVRVNRTRIAKPSHTIRVGDVLTIALRGNIQVLRVLACGRRRGPPAEARQFYQRLNTHHDGPVGAVSAMREAGSARPTKRDRRLIERFTRQD